VRVEGEDVQVPYILVVEDQVETAEMLTSYFEAQGYKVAAVGWGKDALACRTLMAMRCVAAYVLTGAPNTSRSSFSPGGASVEID
jgi:response regulator RpfG family c-di-GMP phosphodiesterase